MLKGTGERITETRALPSFTKIYLTDDINLFIQQGNEQEVTVEGGKKLLPLVKTEIIGGELYLKNANRCKWARSYKKGVINVYLTLPRIESIWNYGSGIIKSTGTIACDSLDIRTAESGDVELTVNSTKVVFVEMNGTGDITLHGKTPLMGFFHIGEGFLHNEDFETDYAWGTSQASGNEYLNVRKSLWAKIEWAGNIYYKGSPPSVEVKITGKGKAIAVN